MRLDTLDSKKAEAAILEAIRFFQEISGKPELARSHVSYARLLKAWGDSTRVREHLTLASGMFREMGMAWDLARAEEVLQDL